EGDRYVVYEHKQSKKLLLTARVRLASTAQTKTFFATYADALQKKYAKRSDESRDGEFLQFTGADGGVLFRCVERDCVELEGGEAALFSTLTKELSWPSLVKTAHGEYRPKSSSLAK